MKGYTSKVFFVTMVASLGGLLFGYDTAVISGAVGALRSFFIDPLESRPELAAEAVFQFKALVTLCVAGVGFLFAAFLFRFLKRRTAYVCVLAFAALGGVLYYAYFLDSPNDLSQNLKNSILGFMISSALIGCIIGSALGDRVANSLGRLRGLVAASLLFVFSSLGSAYPEFFNVFYANDLTAFIIYRIMGGMGIGLASMLSPLYIAEIAPTEIRGKLVSFNQFAIIGGMLVVYFVNYYIAMGRPEAWINTEGWRYMFLSASVPASLFLIALSFVPETPRFQVMKGRDGKALSTLARFNTPQKATETLAEIKQSFQSGDGVKTRWLAFGVPVVIIGILISVFQQLIGINVVLYYAPEIFKGIGMKTDASLLQTIVVGAVNLIFTVLAIFTVDHFGRKKLMLIGGVAMAAGMFGLGFALYAQVEGVAVLLLMLFYIAAFAMSWGPVTWVLLSEIFPNKIKGVMAVAVALQWLTNLAVSWTFPIINENQYLTGLFNHGFAYWIYGVMALLSVLFILKYVPETKGKSLEEIEKIWKK